MAGSPKSLPFTPPPPPPEDGSPPYIVLVHGHRPKPYRDFIAALRYLRLNVAPYTQARIVRVVDDAVLAFKVRTGESVKKASETTHLHRQSRKQKKGNGSQPPR